MTDFPFLVAGFLMKLTVVVWFLCSVVLVLVILVQKGRGGGLSAAFGGMASGVLGSKTGDFLTWVTVGLVFVFLSLSVVIAKFYRPRVTQVGAPPSVRQSQPQQLPQSPQRQDISQPVTAGSGTEADSQNR